MIITDQIKEVRRLRRETGSTSWGLVPTMGFLHEGHLSLIKRAKSETEFCAVSIFINPTQFNRSDDFSEYPVNMKRDIELLEEANVDLLFNPHAELMYPPGFSSWVIVEGLSEVLEGASRPNHFRGVTTIVSKLFHIFEPNRAYFGLKDAQQLLVIKKMIRDLDVGLEIFTCPTVREKDGLALSSRNSRLTTKQRSQAVVLYQSLELAKTKIKSGEKNSSQIILAMRNLIETASEARIDYISANQAETLEEAATINGEILISLAVFFGEVRLIDNFLISVC